MLLLDRLREVRLVNWQTAGGTWASCAPWPVTEMLVTACLTE
jgi:hypothetical protein